MKEECEVQSDRSNKSESELAPYITYEDFKQRVSGQNKWTEE